MRRECPDTIHELRRRSRGIELAIFGADLLRVRHPFLGLWLETRLVLAEHVAQELGGDLGGSRVDGAGVVPGRHGKRAPRCDRPGVERLDRPVDRDACLLVAGHERPLDRSRAAPARQQRRMDVEPQRALEQLVRDQEPVRTDDDGVGAELDRLVEPLRLQGRDPESLRDVPGRRRRDPAPPPARLVRSRQQLNDVVLGRE